MLRQVHSERSVGLHFGQRALLIGALSPVNYIGTALHTRNPELPYKRLANTARVFETIFFGTRAQADHELRRVRLMHNRINGELPEDAGPVPRGTPYSALDPKLMFWTLACIADSGRALYEATVRELSDPEREALWQDYRRFGELFDMPRDAAPATYPEFREHWRDLLASDTMHLTANAREAGINSAFRIPVPSAGRFGAETGNLLILGTVPETVRERYGFDWSRGKERCFRALTATMRATNRLVPKPLRQGRNEHFFAVVEKTERRRVARGRQTWRVSA